MYPRWAALIPDQIASPSATSDPLGIAMWAMQFTPRVVLLERSVLMEVSGSMRLFGGPASLHKLVDDGAIGLGSRRPGWACTSLAALAMTRTTGIEALRVELALQLPTLAQAIDALPFEGVTAVALHGPTLARLGCRTLGDVRALPRGGLSRRFGKDLLVALDQAYGLRPEPYQWLSVPEGFSQRYELPWRAEHADALLAAATRLLVQMCGWLAARQSGLTEFTLTWSHDSLRRSDVQANGSLTVRTAQASRDIKHFTRLLSEHLSRVTVDAPVAEIRLTAGPVAVLASHNASLLPDEVRKGEPLQHTLERLAIRLSPERVCRPVVVADHRLEWMQRWQPADQPLPRQLAPTVPIPLPTWLLGEPLPLAVKDNRPMYQGVLHLVVGPHRVEGGWWHRDRAADAQAVTHHVQRDYWVALSPHAGVLWVFQQRLTGLDIGWYLHGIFG